MPIVQMCCDESGKWHDSKWIILGGLIAPPRTWEVFVRDWRLLLKAHKVEFIHMCEALRRDWKSSKAFRDFEGDNADRDSLLIKMATIASEGIFPVLASVPIPHKERALKSRQLDAFDAALRIAFTQLLDGESLSLISDDEETMAPKMYELWKSFKRTRLKDRAKLAMIGFADDELYPPLQAADMWAYACYQLQLGNVGADGLFTKIYEAIVSHRIRDDVWVNVS